jgi:hypothetical protein
MLTLGAAGCHPMRIVTPPATLPRITLSRPTTIVLTRLTSSERAVRSSDDLPRRLRTWFERTGLTVVNERDLTTSPIENAFLLRIAMIDSRVEGRDGQRSIVNYEVNVFAATGAPLERVATEAGIVPMLDVTGRAPILHTTYTVTLDTDFGQRGSNASELAAFDETVRGQTARWLYHYLAPDLERALESAPQPTIPSTRAAEINPSSSGGEGTMVMH